MLKYDDFNNLLETLMTFEDKKLVINESITRNRNVCKHAQHFATKTQFIMTLKEIYDTTSGANLILRGIENYYGIALELIVNFHLNETGVLEIVEHFEQQTERRTTISIIYP